MSITENITPVVGMGATMRLPQDCYGYVIVGAHTINYIMEKIAAIDADEKTNGWDESHTHQREAYEDVLQFVKQTLERKV